MESSKLTRAFRVAQCVTISVLILCSLDGFLLGRPGVQSPMNQKWALFLAFACISPIRPAHTHVFFQAKIYSEKYFMAEQHKKSQKRNVPPPRRYESVNKRSSKNSLKNSVRDFIATKQKRRRRRRNACACYVNVYKCLYLLCVLASWIGGWMVGLDCGCCFFRTSSLPLIVLCYFFAACIKICWQSANWND